MRRFAGRKTRSAVAFTPGGDDDYNDKAIIFPGFSVLDLHDRIMARLLEHGVRPTSQRVRIAMLVLDRPCHFSAEQLLATLRRSAGGVSKATVYNTLNLFCRQGLIRQVAVDPARLMYDSTTHPHHHFYNAETGELFDISPADLRVSRLPALPSATETERVEVIIRVRPKTSPKAEPESAPESDN